MPISLRLKIQLQKLAVCKLLPNANLPSWIFKNEPGDSGDKNGLWSVTRTRDELSVVCPQSMLPEGGNGDENTEINDIQRDFTCLQVDEGTLDFSLTGILASLAQPLAVAGIPIFAVSTYNTDYVLLPASQEDQAVRILRNAGHSFVDEASS